MYVNRRRCLFEAYTGGEFQVSMHSYSPLLYCKFGPGSPFDACLRAVVK